ncbi:HPr family phosphocarrier protein [Cohnella abietis]|uniref:Phosphocarrier protein HPr n=1 Tax=Cohnella abietis TaxID=2507935 RepID=A0A3T1DCI6_9BACL|nr:HPr family phosphocarrier protein [Cohnella abietis]BBI35830.1 phosphocarrier protein HPr [Cohnella abietis]
MQRTYTVMNSTGIHARPAGKIVNAAAGYPCEIHLVKEGKRFNAKSLVMMISIGAKCGDEITVVAEGDQCELAIEAIGVILSSNH